MASSAVMSRMSKRTAGLPTKPAHRYRWLHGVSLLAAVRAAPHVEAVLGYAGEKLIAKCEEDMTNPKLRPLPRTVARLADQGLTVPDIAWRLRRSPGHISRILQWSELDRPSGSRSGHRAASDLRPVERRVLQARADGVDRAQTAARLRRSPQHVARIERYADLKLARAS